MTAISRRSLLGSAMALGVGACAGSGLSSRQLDVRLSIASHMLELGPGVSYPTFAYNGQVPGPTLRLPRGRATSFEIENRLLAPELVHWHGLAIPSTIDGAEEEGTPPIAPFKTQRFEMRPDPAGTHWYHTHMMGAKALMFGPYSGLFGFVVVEDVHDPGAYDQEVLVALHHWGSYCINGQELRPDDPKHGFEVGYRHGTMNGRLLGHGEPVRVRQGERVLFRLLNASATEITWTALAGHRMKVVAMDGQPVPAQAVIDVLMLGPGERADVLVAMENPGKWILGAVKPQERAKGMGMVVEYAGTTGEPLWTPVKLAWDFKPFAHNGAVATPDERILLQIDRIAGGPGGYNQWTLNGRTWPDTERLKLSRGKRYRLAFENKTSEGHPMHLHRHHFEVASYGGTPCAGLIKDTINIRPHSTTEVDFVAINPGPTLLHCHQAKHQDFGLMALMLYDGDVEPPFDPNAMHNAIETAYCRSDVERA